MFECLWQPEQNPSGQQDVTSNRETYSEFGRDLIKELWQNSDQKYVLQRPAHLTIYEM